jgi:hypothetical protein
MGGHHCDRRIHRTDWPSMIRADRAGCIIRRITTVGLRRGVGRRFVQVWPLMTAGRNESVLRTFRRQPSSYGMQKTSDFRIGTSMEPEWRNSLRLDVPVQTGFLHRSKRWLFCLLLCVRGAVHVGINRSHYRLPWPLEPRTKGISTDARGSTHHVWRPNTAICRMIIG